MPFTYNGCGTKFYGQRDKEPDGSYITTEWIVLVYVPLIPLRSFRIKPTGKSSLMVVYNSVEYLVMPVPLNWQQVRNVYLVGATIVGTFFGFIHLVGQGYSDSPAQTASPAEIAPAPNRR
jgi:hypothetical protein